MWEQYMKNEHYRTIYCNLWESDFAEDPMVAIVNDLQEIFPDDNKTEEIIKIGMRIVLGMLKSIALASIKTSLGVNVDEALKGAAATAGEISDEYLKDYKEQKSTIQEFKDKLTALVSNVKEEEKLPVIFIIDELDRCNPHYAVKALERIKHLFDIPNIMFVLPICKSQLECSIRGYYGSENLDASNYLRRFIDIELELPAPSGDKYCQKLFDHYKYSQYFNNAKGPNSKDAASTFIRIAEIIFAETKTDLRTINKIFAYSRLVVESINSTQMRDINVIFFLCFLKIRYSDLYQDLRSGKYHLDELLEKLEEIFVVPIKKGKRNNNELTMVTYTIADLLILYNSDGYNELEQGVLPKSTEDEFPFPNSGLPQEDFMQALTRSRNYSSFKADGIKYCLEKIDLLRTANIRING